MIKNIFLLACCLVYWCVFFYMIAYSPVLSIIGTTIVGYAISVLVERLLSDKLIELQVRILHP